jgi:uncharacterized repeat protein (TIGR01451 family)
MDGSQGAAYAFAQSGTDWSEQAELTASEGAASDFFGSSVAVSGGTAVIGSFGSNSLQGAAYAFVSPASLSVSATHSSPIFQAGPGTITLTVSNTGSATTAAATVSDTIDSAFTINSASSGCIVSGQDVTCTLASGSSGPSTAFSVYVTASATAPASISNTATLTDSIDTITGGSSSDTIPVGTLAPLVDSSLTQLVLSGSTDTGTCAAGNRTLTATDLLQNTGESTLTNPYPVNATVSQGNTLLSQSADSAIVAPGATVTFTFHIGLASCNTFQLSFDVRSN